MKLLTFERAFQKNQLASNYEEPVMKFLMSFPPYITQ